MKFAALCKLGFYNVKVGKGVRICQRITIQGKGRIEIGDGSCLGVYSSPGFKRGEFYLEARHPEARIIIGKEVYINNSAVIIADKSSINIGDHCLIGPNLFCVDSNFHLLDPAKRLSQDYTCKPVTIGKNVFSGEGVKILRGIQIPDNTILAPGEIPSRNNKQTII